MLKERINAEKIIYTDASKLDNNTSFAITDDNKQTIINYILPSPFFSVYG